MTRKNYTFILLIVGVLFLVFTASCQTNQSPDLELETPDITVESGQTDEVIEEDSALAEEELDLVIDECLLCHTDQQALTDTADPVVVVESENSGEG